MYSYELTLLYIELLLRYCCLMIFNILINVYVFHPPFHQLLATALFGGPKEALNLIEKTSNFSRSISMSSAREFTTPEDEAVRLTIELLFLFFTFIKILKIANGSQKSYHHRHCYFICSILHPLFSMELPPLHSDQIPTTRGQQWPTGATFQRHLSNLLLILQFTFSLLSRLQFQRRRQAT